MVSSRFLRHLAVSCVAMLVAVALFIAVVDPFGVSPIRISIPGFNAHKPNRVDIDRQLKPYEVWWHQPKTIFLGTSRIHQGLDPAILDGTKYAPAYNASVPASEMIENAELLEDFFAHDKKIQHVFVELFFYNFTRPQRAATSRSLGNLVATGLAMNFSRDAVSAALRTISVNAAKTSKSASVEPRGHWLPPAALNTGTTFDARLYVRSIVQLHKAITAMRIEPSALAALERMVEICRRHGAELSLILAPNYPWDDYRLLSLGYWPVLEEWLETLARYPNVLSFSQYNAMLTEPPGEAMRWWYDPIHFSIDFGRLMLRAFLGEKHADIPDNLVRLVTPVSAKNIADERLAGLRSWAAENPHFVQLFEHTKQRILSPIASPIASIGSASDGALTLDGLSYAVVNRMGGAAERMSELADEIEIHGWAIDHANGRPAMAVVAVIGDTVIARVTPDQRRIDIEKGISNGANPAGFSLIVPLRAKPGASPPTIRLFALTHDGKAVQIAAGLPAGQRARIEPMPFPTK